MSIFLLKNASFFLWLLNENNVLYVPDFTKKSLCVNATMDSGYINELLSGNQDYSFTYTNLKSTIAVEVSKYMP